MILSDKQVFSHVTSKVGSIFIAEQLNMQPAQFLFFFFLCVVLAHNGLQIADN